MKTSLAAQVAKKRAELEALQKALRASVRVGDVGVVLNEGSYGDINVGDIVKVVECEDDGDDYCIKARLEDDSDYDIFKVEDIQFITREEARQKLAEGIEGRLDKLFGTAGDAE